MVGLVVMGVVFVVVGRCCGLVGVKSGCWFWGEIWGGLVCDRMGVGVVEVLCGGESGWGIGLLLL